MSVSKIHLDFLVLGAQKAGTTALHDMLAVHPEVELPKTKETHFFSHNDRAIRGSDWYIGQFCSIGNARIRGEIDPEYMFVAHSAETIHALTDVRKFIVILRHPLERAFSQYQMSRRRGYETLDFSSALSQESARLVSEKSDFAHDHWSYTARSLYSKQISRFQSRFPDADILFLRSDELSSVGYDQMCAFIGTVPRARSACVDVVRSNVASAPRYLTLRNFLYAPGGKSLIRKAIMSVIPEKIKSRIFKYLDKINQVPAADSRDAAFNTVPAYIIQTMLEDLVETEKLCRLDLSDWKEGLSILLDKSLVTK